MSFIPDQYQTEAAEWIRRRRVGAVKAPAGFGKTLVAAMALRHVVMAKVRTEKVRLGWLANTNEQCGQAKLALQTFPDMLPFLSYDIFCAGSGNDLSGYDVVVVDEAHHVATAPSWMQQVLTVKGALWGFTATPPKEKKAREAFLEVFKESFEVTREQASHRLVTAKVVMLDDTDGGLREVIDRDIGDTIVANRKKLGWFMGNQHKGRIAMNTLLEANVSFRTTDFEEHYALIKNRGLEAAYKTKLDNTVDGELRRRLSWGVGMKHGVEGNRARTAAVVRVANHHVRKGDYVLVLAAKVDYCKTISKDVEGARVVCSAIGKKKRAEAIGDFIAGELRCIVATSLADEGLDLPRANVLVLASAGQSSAKTEQRTGRVLRRFKDKDAGIIYDFEDRFHPMMERHSKARQAVYRKLGYEFVARSEVC